MWCLGSLSTQGESRWMCEFTSEVMLLSSSLPASGLEPEALAPKHVMLFDGWPHDLEAKAQIIIIQFWNWSPLKMPMFLLCEIAATRCQNSELTLVKRPFNVLVKRVLIICRALQGLKWFGCGAPVSKRRYVPLILVGNCFRNLRTNRNI